MNSFRKAFGLFVVAGALVMTAAFAPKTVPALLPAEHDRGSAFIMEHDNRTALIVEHDRGSAFIMEHDNRTALIVEHDHNNA